MRQARVCLLKQAGPYYVLTERGGSNTVVEVACVRSYSTSRTEGRLKVEGWQGMPAAQECLAAGRLWSNRLI